MPFQLFTHPDNKIGLVAICDVCGKRVYAGTGNIIWNRSAQRAGKPHAFYIACKDECDDVLERRLGADTLWQDIDIGLIYLLNSTRTNVREAKQKAYAMSHLIC